MSMSPHARSIDKIVYEQEKTHQPAMCEAMNTLIEGCTPVLSLYRLKEWESPGENLIIAWQREVDLNLLPATRIHDVLEEKGWEFWLRDGKMNSSALFFQYRTQ